jgi:L-asparaginase II
MATMLARFARAQVSSPRRREAVTMLQEAMRAHPELLSGTGQPGVVLAAVTDGRILVKTGAEGFISAFIPRQGIGIALKIADGEARARMPALLAVLAATGLLDAGEQSALRPLAEPTVLNSAGAVVGQIRATRLSI